MGSDEIDYDEVAHKVLDRLDTGQAIGDKIILSRRQLVALAAGGLSVGALTTLGVDEATAQQAVGQVGTDSERVDVFANIVDANEITAPNELDGNDLTDDGTTVYQAGSDTVGDGTTSADHESIKTDKQTVNHGLQRGRNGERVDAAKSDGADADARLDAAVSDADNMNVIALEQATYSDDRTISKDLSFVGVGDRYTGGTVIDGNWTFDARCVVRSVGVGAVTLTFNDRISYLLFSDLDANADIQANNNVFRFIGNNDGSVTFASGTSNGLADACTQTAVTDNGANNVGDI